LSTITFPEFESDALAQGFDEAVVRQWAPDVVVADHTHPFAVKALVVQGEMWLGVGGDTRHLRSGDTFELECGAVHAERYGPEGATYWVARRRGRSSGRPDGETLKPSP
jgi:AraC-like ligand binding domain